jgi:hypothetical protein
MSKMISAACSDEAVGLAATVEPWKARLWPALRVSLHAYGPMLVLLT